MVLTDPFSPTGMKSTIEKPCVTDVILADAPRAREFARFVDYEAKGCCALVSGL
jgi:hypothetical protein